MTTVINRTARRTVGLVKMYEVPSWRMTLSGKGGWYSQYPLRSVTVIVKRKRSNGR